MNPMSLAVGFGLLLLVVTAQLLVSLKPYLPFK
jgi:hypothetical protein